MLPLPIAFLAGPPGPSGCPETAPATPGYLIISELDGHLYLDWGDVACEDGYDVYWDNAREDGVADTLLVSRGVGQTFYDHTGLTNGLEYTYAIVATNAYGDSDPTSTETGIPSATPGAPNAPSGVAAAMQVPNTTVRVTWSDNSGDETGFNLYRSVNGGGFVFHDSVGANVVQYDDTGLTLGNSYSYRVSAENGAGESDQAGPATVNNLGAVGVPTGLGISGITSSSLLLSWSYSATPPSGVATSFKIYRNGVHVHTVSAGVFSWDNTGLEDGTLYTYEVAAVNSVGEGTKSSSKSGATLLPAPSGLTASPMPEESPTFYRFAWTDNSDNENQFELERDSSPWTAVGGTQADVAAGDAEGHTWRVRAGGNPGVAASGYSNTVAV